MPLFITGMLWFAAIGCLLMAGLYFAFSVFIMTALGRVERVRGISAMNSINATITRSLFMPLFLGTTVASLLLAGLGALGWGGAGAMAMVGGGLIYFAGMFLCTMFCNVPLNNALAAVDAASAVAAPVWARYLREWTLWNHVRTISSTVAGGLFIVALLQKG